MRQLVWLTSYPKSGNTWIRAVLSNCLHPDREFDLDDIDVPIASSRPLLDLCLGIETQHLLPGELNALLPHAYLTWAQDESLGFILKNHAAFLRLDNGVPVFPPECSRGVIHVVRDPRDVAISLASHLGVSTDAAIGHMNAPEYGLLLSSSSHIQIAQPIGTWSAHCRSWMTTPMEILRVRYEDMLAEPFTLFTRIIKFCGISIGDDVLRKAIDTCSFENLQAKELESGFSERSLSGSGNFFRKGRAGGWREVLSPSQVFRIESAHGIMMQELGYALSRAEDESASEA